MPRRVPLIAVNTVLRLFRPPSFQPTHFQQRDALRIMYDEVVPDSEPEREEQRRHLDEERRVKRTRKRQGKESMRNMSFVLSSSPEPDLSALFKLFFRWMTQFPSKGLPSPLSRKAPPKPESDARSVISISGESFNVYT